jgi:heat-inducible transcriptional repressor
MSNKQLKKDQGSLSDRDEELLEEAVGMYIKTGRPVASKAISTQIEGRLSPSSIRGTLGQLTKRGFLAQHHPSGGRIPTTKAYRYYIDHLLKPHPIPLGLSRRLEEGFYRAFIEQGEASFLGLSKVLASLTKQVGLVVLKSDAFKAELITPQVGSEAWMIMAVIEKKLKNPYTLIVSSLSKELKRGIDLKESLLFSHYSHHIGERHSFKKEEAAVFWAGLGNLASIPEFGSKEGLRRLLEMAEEREKIGEAAFKAFASSRSRVNVLFSRRDLGLCWSMELSLVVSGYTSEKAGDGLLGVMGPIRMDYARIIPFIAHAAGMLERALPLDTKKWI